VNKAIEAAILSVKSGVRGRAGLGLLACALSGSLAAQTVPGSDAVGAAVPAKPATALAKPNAPPARAARDESYVIGAEDVLAINVWKEQDLTHSIPVRSDGKISLPLAGELQAAGRTPAQLEDDITARLRSFVTDPEVTVMVQQVNSKKFNILGQVAKPGSYPLALAGTVMDAIAAAGGFRDFAKQKSVYVLRRNPDGTEQKLPFNYKNFIRGKDLSQNIRLESNDTVIVP